MKQSHHKGQNGVILVQVLVLLTLFGLVGVSFTYYAADVQCERNPTNEIRDGRCIRTIGNATDHRP
jgi:hypothetical protein